MRHMFLRYVLCWLVVLLALTLKAERASAHQDPEGSEAAGSSAPTEAETLRQRYAELGRQLQEEKDRIAQRDPDFDLAEFVKGIGKALEPPFEHRSVTSPVRRALTDRYSRTRISVVYADKSIADILRYLEAIEEPEHGVRVTAVKLAADDEGEARTLTMTITFSVVTSVPSLELEMGTASDDPPDETEDPEVLRQMVEARAAELAAFTGGSTWPAPVVLRELAKICHGATLPSEEAEGPADTAADMAPLLEPSGPWNVHISAFEMQHGRVKIEGSAANDRSVNELRRALEASHLFREVKLSETGHVGERTTLRMWLYPEPPQQAE